MSCPPEKPIWCKNLSATHQSGCAGRRYDKSVVGLGDGECQGCSNFGPALNVDGQVWFPYVVLPSVERAKFELRPNTAQPVLLTFRSAEDTPEGKYTYRVSVTSTGTQAVTSSQTLDVDVQVFNFTVPLEPSKLSLWGVLDTSGFGVVGKENWNTTKFHDFLLDHRVPVSSLYSGGEEGFPSVDTAELKRLWSRGQRVWEPYNHYGAGREGARGFNSTHLEGFITALNHSVAKAMEADWPVENMWLYAFDEPGASQMPGLEQLSRMVKQTIPGIKIATCGTGQWEYYYGVCDAKAMANGCPSIGDGTGNGTIPLPRGEERLKYVDLIVPRAWEYSNNWSNPENQKPGQGADFYKKAREGGKMFGWYVSGIPVGKAGLNWYVEYPPMRSRLMAGVAAVKQESDALLYYRIDAWTAYEGTGGIQDVLPTMEVLDFKYCDADCAQDGEGLIIVPSPSGALSTLQFENIRDGLEDVEWYALLSKLLAEAADKGHDVSAEAPVGNVPDAVFQYVQFNAGPKNFTYTQSPSVLRAERLRVAAAIERIREKLAGHASKSSGSVSVFAADSMQAVFRDSHNTMSAAQRAAAQSLEMAQNEFEGLQVVVAAHESDTPVEVEVVAASGGPSFALNSIGFVHRGPCPYATPAGVTCPHENPVWCKNLTATGKSGCAGKWVSGNNCNGDPPICDKVMGLNDNECLGCSNFGAYDLYEVDKHAWYPYVVLPQVDTAKFTVAKGTSQPVLLTFHSQNTSPGTYTFHVSVKSTSSRVTETAATLDVSVTVHNFSVPLAPSKLSLWGVGDTSGMMVSGDQYNTTQLHDFLLDHRIPVNALYAGAGGFPSVDTAELKRLWDRGQRVWEPAAHWGAGRGGKTGYKAATVQAFLKGVNDSIAKAEAAGWLRKNMLLYAFDEPGVNQMPGLEQFSRMAKEALGPDIQIATCGNSQWEYYYGVGNASIGDGTGNGTIPLPPGEERLKYVDLIVPRAWLYSANWSDPANQNPGYGQDFIKKARAGGKKIGWYVSGTPVGKAGLNWYVEYPPMRSRLMAGVAAAKQESDALLYYRLDGWQPYKGTGGIQDISPTQEVLDFKYCDADCSGDGEGLVIVPSPSGVLSTLQMENLRDGLEDVEWYYVLSTLIQTATAAGVSVSAAEKAAAAVPDELFAYVQFNSRPDNFTYSQDPSSLRSQRSAVASAIHSLQAKLSRQV